MKPPAFQYLRPNTVSEALDMLAAAGEDAKILAGGQSLVPMLNFRLLKPSVLVDINRIGELDFISESETGLRIGALFTNQAQNALEDLPLIWQNTAPKLDQPAVLTGVNSNYLWKLLNSNALHTAHGDTWVITHGQLITQTMCVNSSCKNS